MLNTVKEKTVILGIGNTICGDDGVGIYAARALKKNCGQVYEVKETQNAGFEILDMLTDFDQAMIIDSIKTEGGKPGDIYRFNTRELKEISHIYSLHKMGLPNIIKLAESTGVKFPGNIVIYAIEIDKTETFTESLSLTIEGTVPKVVQMIKNDLMCKKAQPEGA